MVNIWLILTVIIWLIYMINDVMMVNNNLVGAILLPPGWWLTYPSEKYEFVSWEDYSQYMEK